MESFGINKKNLLLGILFLLAGTMVYLVDRPVGSTYFLYKYTSIQLFFHHMPNLYGKLGMFAPEFFHPLAFSLISIALVSTKKSRIVIYIAWFIINCIFELGQRYGVELAEYLPKWFDSVPLFGTLRIFLLNGWFDVYDLVAIGLGSLTALLIGELLLNKGGNNGEEHSEQKIYGTFAVD